MNGIRPSAFTSMLEAGRARLPTKQQLSGDPDYQGRVIRAVTADGTQEWWRNGELHRDDGPAITHADGTQEWWRNDKQIKTPRR